MDLMKMLPYGYKTYTGKKLSNESVDYLNALYSRCNAFILAGRKAPIELLNGIHNTIVTASSRLL
jgi:hypothetical protein